MYHVYGYDTKTGESCLLNSLLTEKDAITWAIGYADFINTEYNKLCVQYEKEVGDGITEEVVSWSVYNEPMPWSDTNVSDNAHEEF